MSNELNLGMKCIKYMMFTMTLMFVLAAALLVSIGSTINYTYHSFDYFLESRHYSPATLLIVIGTIMLFVSLFGCLGAIKESTCMINFFALLLTLVFIVEIGTAIAAFRLRHGTYSLVEKTISAGMTEYYGDNEVRDSIDFLQSRLGCCGVNAYDDWERIDVTNNNTQIPMSCCAVFNTQWISTEGGSITRETCEQYYASGCLPTLVHFIHQAAALLGTGAMTIAFIQLIGIIFSIMLAKAVRRTKTERECKRMEIIEQLARQRMTIEKNVDQVMPVVYLPSEGQTNA